MKNWQHFQKTKVAGSGRGMCKSVRTFTTDKGPATDRYLIFT